MTKTKKLGLISLILMIFTSVFGFTNIPRAFYLMGYGAIPWYIFSAVLFFIPYAFMMAEYGAAFKDEKGGIYSWMSKSVGPKFAFIGTFMWYTSYIIWMVSVSSSIWVPFSNLLFGSDTTSTWSLFGLSGPKLLGVLGILLILVITAVSSKGLKNISKIASIGGIFVMCANVVLLLGGIIVLLGNGFHPAQELTLSALTTSPNAAYQSPLGMLGFVVFAIFAYGGLEAVGGLVDQTENASVVFPKAIKIAAIVIAVGYSLAILFVGFFTNWNAVLTNPGVNMANVSYVILNNLGVQIGSVFGMSASASAFLGSLFARFIGLSMLLALTGGFFTLIYSPIKQLIEGTPKEIWPKKLTKLNKDGMPVVAMWVQCAIVIIIIASSAFAGSDGSSFLNDLILMGNVSMTIPYMFLAIAFIFFKKNTSIEKPFEMYKSKKVGTIWAIIVTCVVGFANVFTIIQPAIESNNYRSTFIQLAGPVIFSIIAIILYMIYEKRYLKNKDIL